MFEIQHASLSDPGRRHGNEDALHAASHGPIHYAVVADGAGGHHGGAIASHQVVQDLRTALDAHAHQTGGHLLPDQLTALITGAHARLQTVQREASGVTRMHTTVVVLWLHAHHGVALWSHVGDSRLYRLRYGSIDHISQDDSVVQRMVEAGLLTAAQALEHPARHQLLSALGIETEVEPHTLPGLVRIEDGDAFLLCSDGWWEPLGNELITRLYREASSPQDWLERMQRAIRAGNQPHQDNYSAVALWVNDPSETTRPFADSR